MCIETVAFAKTGSCLSTGKQRPTPACHLMHCLADEPVHRAVQLGNEGGNNIAPLSGVDAAEAFIALDDAINRVWSNDDDDESADGSSTARAAIAQPTTKPIIMGPDGGEREQPCHSIQHHMHGGHLMGNHNIHTQITQNHHIMVAEYSAMSLACLVACLLAGWLAGWLTGWLHGT
jgi:hypothetical protein